MKELLLKYGCNPHQKPARVYAERGELPLEALNGQISYINLLDALHAWQLVRELKRTLNLPAAASFKHVNPAGAALGLPLGLADQRACGAEGIEGLNESPLACAYARARGADRMSSFGDFIALSDVCDATTAALIKSEVSDGIIAPGYTPQALELLKNKRNGGYSILCIDEGYDPGALERKQVFGITFEQPRNNTQINTALLNNPVTRRKELGEDAKRDLLLALITLKYTQSNSVCYACGGQTIGVGAGQQSRIHCTRLAGDKADIWWLRRHERTLALPFLSSIKRPDRDNLIDSYASGRSHEAFAQGWRRFFSERPVLLAEDERTAHLGRVKGVALASDAFFPFSDNIERAFQSGVTYIAQPGGSIRDEAVIEACDKYGMTMLFTGLRLFHH